MIISFSVSNFRNIKDKVTLSFEAEKSKDLEDYYVVEPIPGLRLLKVAFIYGPNGSGKSNLLMALESLAYMISNPAEKKTDKLLFHPFLFDAVTPNQPTNYEIVFVSGGTKYSYNVAFIAKSIISEELYSYNPNKSLVFLRSTDEIKQLSHIEFGSKVKLKKSYRENLEANTLWNNTVFSGFLKTNIESLELKDVTDWFQYELMPVISPRSDLLQFVSERIEKKEIHDKVVVELLKKADFKISDIVMEENEKKPFTDLAGFIDTILERTDSLTSDSLTAIKKTGKFVDKKIVFEHSVFNGDKTSKYKLPYSEESEGTRRYYQFSGLLDFIIHHAAVFPIDEIESSLHPDLVRHFLLVFLVNSKNSQIIATTHHRELLMDRDILRDDVIWLSEKKDDGSMDLYSVADFDSSVVRNTSSLFNAYKSGKLGAVPHPGDYYLNLDGAEN